jgi:hypothetical protein
MTDTEKQYRMDPRINASLLKLFSGDLDPEIAKHKALNPSAPTEVMALGTLYHALHETGGEMPFNFVVAPYRDFRTKEAKQWRQDNLDSGYTIIKQDVVDQAYDMYEKTKKSIPSWMLEGESEVACYTEEHKCLIDRLCSDRRGVDWKSTSCLSAEQFQRDCLKYGYFLQAYHYSMVADLSEFWFVACSTVKPYPVWVFKVGDEAMAYGKEQWEAAMENMNNANRQSEFVLDPPHWFEFTQDQTAEEAFEL